MNEFQKALLLFCVVISIIALIVLYTFQKYGYSCELCRDDECKIYKVKVVRDNL